MNDQSLERLAPLSGLAAGVLLVASAVLIDQWEYLPSAGELQAFYTDNSGRVMAGGYLGVVAAAGLMWFGASLKGYLAPHDGRLASLAFGGLVAAGAVTAAAYSMIVAAGARAGADGGISEASAATMYDLYGTVIASGAAAGLAVALFASALATLRHGGLDRWLAWVAIVTAIGLLTPASYILLGVALVWIAVVSAILFRDESPSEPTAE